MESPDRRFKMKWWGWGAEGVRFPLPTSEVTLEYFRSRFGLTRLEPAAELPLESVEIPPSRADAELVGALGEIVGPENCRTDHRERVLHSAGKSYKDLLQLRSLRMDRATDAVVYPRSEGEVVELLEYCGRERLAVVPFGGGSSVVGGIDPQQGDQRLVVTVDLAYLNQILEINKTSSTATVEAGIFGPELESQLRNQGFVLGHYPQSFEFSTLGGWIATRSSGQNCLRYGGIDKLVESVRIVTPAGTVETLHVPRRADGPDTMQMIVGSEGTFGIVVSATVRVRKLPADQDYFMFAMTNFHAAVDACRSMLQGDVCPALVRISDEEETAATLALGHQPAKGLRRVVRRGAKWLMQRRGLLPPSLSTVLVGLEGAAEQNRALRSTVRRHFASRDAFYLGRSPGQRWLETRFQLPYLRDELLANGLLVDTLETATTWSNVESLHAAVREAIKRVGSEHGNPVTVYAHLSHLYRDGAAIYFTLLGRQSPDDPVGQWWAIKNAAGDAIRQHGAVISHHHGVGTDHRAQTGRTDVEQRMLSQLKQAVDPDGIMNPGKLL